MLQRKTVALVLGCGSSRGWAHIGTIEALEEENIPIDYIVGCSVGAYVGVIYASGSIKSLKEFVLKMDGKKVFSYFDIMLPRSGILNGTKRLKELFTIHTDVQDFSELNIPVRKRVQIEKTPRKQESHKNELINKLSGYYETAGLSFKSKINGLLSNDTSTPDIIETVTTSINIMQDRISRINHAVAPPDILIQPHLGGLKMLDFDQVEHTIEEGYIQTMNKIDDIKALLEPV